MNLVQAALRSLCNATVTVRSLPSNVRLLGRGAALLLLSAPLAGSSLLFLQAIASLLPVLQVWLTKLLMDTVTAGASGQQDAVAMAVTLAVFYALTLIVRAGISPVERTLTAWLQNQAVAEVDRRLIRAGTRLVDLYRVERPAFQDELHHVREGTAAPFDLLFLVQQSVTALLTLAGLLLLLAQLHLLLPLLLIALSGPHLVAEARIGRQQFNAIKNQSRAAREMDYCARITTEPAAAKEVRVFGLGDLFLQRFHKRFAAALAEITPVRLAHLRFSMVFSGLYALTLALGFWYVTVQATVGQLTLGDVALYVGAIYQAERLTFSLVAGFGFLPTMVMRWHALFNFLDNASPVIKVTPHEQARQAPAALQSGIELRGVHFRYPEGMQSLLVDINMVLPAGKVTALVGANGVGKSTIVKLLTRMYDPDKGSIILDGMPLASYALASLRQSIAVVYQDFAQFSLTLRENIGVGAFASGATSRSLEEAARLASVDELATKLPQGYDTQLTRKFDGGVELSGGEWQKIAQARAFIREAALVILDEPTAALDAEAEYRLFHRFRELVRGKTALLISHRFSTVRIADHILVLENGQIIESGSHDDLVARKGIYAQLFEMQAGRYR